MIFRKMCRLPWKVLLESRYNPIVWYNPHSMIESMTGDTRDQGHCFPEIREAPQRVSSKEGRNYYVLV